MLSRFGFIGKTIPSYPEPIRFLKILYPGAPTRSVAPMTAILFGLKILSRVSTPVFFAPFYKVRSMGAIQRGIIKVMFNGTAKLIIDRFSLCILLINRMECTNEKTYILSLLHCKSKNTVKNGFYKYKDNDKQQRYLCKKCDKLFLEKTTSPFHQMSPLL